MKIERKNFDAEAMGANPYTGKDGTSVLSETAVFSFPNGIPAFEDSKRFVVILNPNIRPFVYLKSLDVADLGFVCIDPFLVNGSYSVKIPGKDLSLLGLKSPSSALVLCMVTIDKDPKNTTCNLLAPIIMNVENMVGRQVILEEQYPVRFKIWEGIEAIERGKEPL